MHGSKYFYIYEHLSIKTINMELIHSEYNKSSLTQKFLWSRLKYILNVINEFIQPKTSPNWKQTRLCIKIG